jgi:hypothetical protein
MDLLTKSEEAIDVRAGAGISPDEGVGLCS